MNTPGTHETRDRLLQKSSLHREQLEEDVRMISEKTERILINAAVIGGALAVTYFLVSRFSGSKGKPKGKTKKIKLIQATTGDAGKEEVEYRTEPQEPGMLAQIGTALATQASAFLLALAKEKLTEFLASAKEAQEEKDNSKK